MARGCTRSMEPSATATSQLTHLPSECLEAIFEQLPVNCIPLTIRQLSKHWRQHYVHHTTVALAGDTSYLPACAVSAKLPYVQRTDQKQKVLAAMARCGDLQGMQQVAQHIDTVDDLLCSETVLCAAALGGHLGLVRWLVEERGCSKLASCSKAAAYAAAGGELHVLQRLLVCQPPFMLDSDTLAHAARNGHLEMLQWLHSTGRCSDWDTSVAAAAAAGGHVEVLQLLHTIACRMDATACEQAAIGGSLDALQFLKAIGVPWSDRQMSISAANGHLHVVRWLHGIGCPWDVTACSGAAAFGHLEVLKYLLQHGCPHGGTLCQYAAAGQHRALLLWLREHGHPWTEGVCGTAVAYRDVRLLQWLREQSPPCPWGASVIGTALTEYGPGTVECLEYALSNGCPWEREQYRAAQRVPELRHVQWPGVRRSPRLQKQ